MKTSTRSTETDIEGESSIKPFLSKWHQKCKTHFNKTKLLLFNNLKENILRKYFLNFPFIMITSIKEQ